MKGSALVVTVFLVIGCSSDSGSGGAGGGSGAGGSGGGSGQCPNVAGSWTVSQSNCPNVPVGAVATLTQSGCTATDSDGTQLSIGSDGSFSYNPQGATCSGMASETSITLNCTGGGQPCSATLQK